MNGTIIAITLLAVIVVLALISNGIKIIGPQQRGMYMRMGRFVRVLNPGMNFVAPLISTVVKIDLSEQAIEIPRQSVMARNACEVSVNGYVRLRVVDPKRAFFNVTNYRTATTYLAQRTVARLVGEMTADEAVGNRNVVEEKLRTVLTDSCEKWGVRIEVVGISEMFPASTGSAQAESPKSGIPQGRVEHGELKIGRYGVN